MNKNYYDIVVNVARVLNKPRLTKTELLKVSTRIANAINQKLDESLLITAWKEFSKAPLSKVLAY